MDHVRGIAAIPFILVIGVTGWVWDRLHPETTEQYLARKYPGLYVHDWTDET